VQAVLNVCDAICKENIVKKALYSLGGYKPKEIMANYVVSQFKTIYNTETYSFEHTKVGLSTFDNNPCLKLSNIINNDGIFPSDYVGMLPLTTKGSITGYVDGLKKLVIGNPMLEIVLFSGVSGIVLQALGIEDCNIILNFEGNPCIGKSISHHLPLSLFGDAVKLFSTFNNTANRFEEMQTSYKILPFIIDDHLLGFSGLDPKKKAEELSKLIFRMASGRKKGRYKDSLSSNKFYGAILTSTEKPIIPLIDNLDTKGQLLRILEIKCVQGDLTKTAEHSTALEKFYKEYAGVGGEAFGLYFIRNIDSVEGRFEKWRTVVNSRLPNSAEFNRVAKRVALLMTKHSYSILTNDV
jgi:hypothetical protein